MKHFFPSIEDDNLALHGNGTLVEKGLKLQQQQQEQHQQQQRRQQ